MTNHTAILTSHQRRTRNATAPRATHTGIIPAPVQAAPAASSLVAGLLMATWVARLSAQPPHPVGVRISMRWPSGSRKYVPRRPRLR